MRKTTGCEMRGETVLLIYAGGLARRMGGVNKALVTLAGEPMAARVARRLKGCAAVSAINANRDLFALSAYADAVLPDTLEGFPGPLAGLDAVARAKLPGVRWVLTAPCDSPFVPEDLLERFAAARAEHPAAKAFYAATETNRHYAFALIRLDALSDAAFGVRAYLQRGEHRLGGWLRDCAGAVAVVMPDDRAFDNLNTLEEVRAAEDLLDASH